MKKLSGEGKTTPPSSPPRELLENLVLMRFFERGTTTRGQSPFELDAARSAYQKHVDLVAPQLPPPLLSLARGHLNLQEASVRLCTLDEKRDQLRLVLRLHAGDAEQTVELVYDGVDPEALDVAALASVASDARTELLYDEVDVLDNGAYAHRVLFGRRSESGGDRELELRFTRFQVRPPPSLLTPAEPASRFVHLR